MQVSFVAVVNRISVSSGSSMLPTTKNADTYMKSVQDMMERPSDDNKDFIAAVKEIVLKKRKRDFQTYVTRSASRARTFGDDVFVYVTGWCFEIEICQSWENTLQWCHYGVLGRVIRHAEEVEYKTRRGVGIVASLRTLAVWDFVSVWHLGMVQCYNRPSHTVLPHFYPPNYLSFCDTINGTWHYVWALGRLPFLL